MPSRLDVILEFHLSITSFDPPLILNLSPRNFLLQGILSLYIPNLPSNQTLTQTQRPKREAISQLVRRRSVNLSRNRSGSVAHRLLESDGGCSAVVRGDIDVEPG